MKSIIAIACAFLLATNIQTKNTNELLKDLESKLQAKLTTQLDKTGVNQLENLIELTAFSQLTDLAQLNKDELKEFIDDLPNFKNPDVDMTEYETELKRIDKA